MSAANAGYKFLFAGGGTGGHLYPAIAVAEQIKLMKPGAEILFVGTKNKIEGKVVPKLGYKFKSVWIKGLYRNFNLQNLLFPIRLIVSVIQSLIINIIYKPAVAVGSGGYAAGPAIWAAWVLGAKVILLEQNSYPGITTRLLERFAAEIHLGFEDSKKYLKRKNILHNTGNPVRQNLGSIEKRDALKQFGLSAEKKTLLILGGSLGAKSLNNAVKENVNAMAEKDIQLIWQTGKTYFEENKSLMNESVKIFDFIEDMNAAYSACDLMLARAGATTIAEILALGIPAVLVPSPNVAENHQYYNAKSLSDKNAAVLAEDENIKSEFGAVIIPLIFNNEELKKLKMNAKALAKPDAAKQIARSAINYAESK